MGTFSNEQFKKGVKKFSIFINKASSELEAKQNFNVFSKNLVHKFLDARAYYAGFLPMSKAVSYTHLTLPTKA